MRASGLAARVRVSRASGTSAGRSGAHRPAPGRHGVPDRGLVREFWTDEGRQFVGAIRDLTGPAAARRRAARERAEVRTIADTLPCGIYIYQDGHFTFANACPHRDHGLHARGAGADQLLGRHPSRLAPRRCASAPARARPAQPVAQRYEIRILRKDGQPRWVDLSDEIIVYEGHRAALGTVFDITDRRQTELLEPRPQPRDRDGGDVIQPLPEILGELVELVERQLTGDGGVDAAAPGGRCCSGRGSAHAGRR